MDNLKDSLSVIIPAKNEATTIGILVSKIRDQCPGAEIIVVNDGSTDDTARVALHAGAQVVSHPKSLGNGAAIKSGTRKAHGSTLVMLDADGQHQPQDIPKLIEQLTVGYDMAIGARTAGSHANFARSAANGLYNMIASFITGQTIPDLTSGFRAVRAEHFKKFLFLLPNGFSYPTTITMAFMRAGYPVNFTPIDAKKREGASHIRPIRDGIRFFIIIFKVATLYSPLKIFLPTSASFFLAGLGYYTYTYVTIERFTNMSALLVTASIIVLLIGIVSEQIAGLLYKDIT